MIYSPGVGSGSFLSLLAVAFNPLFGALPPLLGWSRWSVFHGSCLFRAVISRLRATEVDIICTEWYTFSDFGVWDILVAKSPCCFCGRLLFFFGLEECVPLLSPVFFSFSVLRITEILLFLCIRTGSDGIRKTLFSKLVTSWLNIIWKYMTQKIRFFNVLLVIGLKQL